MFVYFSSDEMKWNEMEVQWFKVRSNERIKLGKTKNAANADRMMKFIDENELNNIWTIRCDNSETVRDRMSVFSASGKCGSADRRICGSYNE